MKDKRERLATVAAVLLLVAVFLGAFVVGVVTRELEILTVVGALAYVSATYVGGRQLWNWIERDPCEVTSCGAHWVCCACRWSRRLEWRVHPVEVSACSCGHRRCCLAGEVTLRGLLRRTENENKRLAAELHEVRRSGSAYRRP